jgi:type III secretory pathway component EscT
MKFIALCIQTEYEKLTLPPDQMLKIYAECILHIKEVSKGIYIACIIANPISVVISKLPLRVRKKILEAPLVNSLKQLILVTSMMRIMRLKIDAKAN